MMELVAAAAAAPVATLTGTACRVAKLVYAMRDLPTQSFVTKRATSSD